MPDDPEALAATLDDYYAGRTVDPARPTPLISATGALPERAGPAPPPEWQGEHPTGRPPFPQELYDNRSLMIIALRMEGYSYNAIVEKTGLTKNQIRTACFRARQGGKLRDVIDHLDNEAVPQAIDNLNEMLQNGDKEATFKVLEGRGAFRRFSGDKVAAGVVGGLPQLQVNFLTPEGGKIPTVIINSDRGAVIGRPREDAE